MHRFLSLVCFVPEKNLLAFIEKTNNIHYSIDAGVVHLD
jgi:hypothetical protein